MSLLVNGPRVQASPTALLGIEGGILGGKAENPGVTLQKIEVGA